MKAMILAAGLGQRMRPLTDQLPKPMLRVADKPLLQYHLEALANAGITEVIINLAYLGEKIRDFVGDGSRFSLRVSYSQEPEPLETGGALLKALPLLGEEPFLLINGDVWTDLSLAHFCQQPLSTPCKAHLLLVHNPDFHPQGDFTLGSEGLLTEENKDSPKYTFAGISLIDPQLIAQYPKLRPKFPLGELLRHGIPQKMISGEVYLGGWSDVGTPERLQQLDQQLKAQLAR
ncbi:MAG TPA: nucleotidyltransferase family protein [Cellvibrio sp.]|nr:nucleotidyltransferase family protein [Cellvibrio sp.]